MSIPCGSPTGSYGLGYRESLIYREWQDAIGDGVIVKDEHSTARKYRIIGLEEFERLMESGTSKWTEPLREFIEDVGKRQLITGIISHLELENRPPLCLSP